MLSYRILVFEKFSGKSLIDNGDQSRIGFVLVRNRTTLQDLSADRLEVAIADSHPRCRIFIASRRRWCLPLYVDLFAPVVSIHRTVHRKTDLAHSRDRRQRIVQLSIRRSEL